MLITRDFFNKIFFFLRNPLSGVFNRQYKKKKNPDYEFRPKIILFKLSKKSLRLSIFVFFSFTFLTFVRRGMNFHNKQ